MGDNGGPKLEELLPDGTVATLTVVEASGIVELPEDTVGLETALSMSPRQALSRDIVLNGVLLSKEQLLKCNAICESEKATMVSAYKFIVKKVYSIGDPALTDDDKYALVQFLVTLRAISLQFLSEAIDEVNRAYSSGQSIEDQKAVSDYLGGEGTTDEERADGGLSDQLWSLLGQNLAIDQALQSELRCYFVAQEIGFSREGLGKLMAKRPGYSGIGGRAPATPASLDVDKLKSMMEALSLVDVSLGVGASADGAHVDIHNISMLRLQACLAKVGLKELKSKFDVVSLHQSRLKLSEAYYIDGAHITVDGRLIYAYKPRQACLEVYQLVTDEKRSVNTCVLVDTLLDVYKWTTLLALGKDLYGIKRKAYKLIMQPDKSWVVYEEVDQEAVGTTKMTLSKKQLPMHPSSRSSTVLGKAVPVTVEPMDKVGTGFFKSLGVYGNCSSLIDIGQMMTSQSEMKGFRTSTVDGMLAAISMRLTTNHDVLKGLMWQKVPQNALPVSGSRYFGHAGVAGPYMVETQAAAEVFIFASLGSAVWTRKVSWG